MQSQTKRSGFTLIELMVAMALTLLIMVILSQAFVMSIDTFTGLKAIGDMQSNMRAATVILRDDLSEDHFEAKRRLSDLFNVNTVNVAGIVNRKPQEGFIAILQPTSAVGAAAATFATPYVNEGNDADGMPSFRATDHLLYMTVKRKGNRPENFFTAALLGDPAVLNAYFTQSTAHNTSAVDMPDITWASRYQPSPSPLANQGFYNSQWAEVLYYLFRTGTTEEPNNPTSTNGTPTYALYRAQFVMVPQATNVNGIFAATLASSTFAPMACNPDPANLKFYSPDAAALGQRVVPDLLTFAPNARILAASTMVLPHVTSFHIQQKTLITPTAPKYDEFRLTPVQPPPWLYDTTKFNQAGYINNFGLKALQITLRVWDPKTRLTRQVTVIQDM